MPGAGGTESSAGAGGSGGPPGEWSRGAPSCAGPSGRPGALGAGGTPWPDEVRAADELVRSRWEARPGPRDVVVRLVEDREEFEALGGTDAVPGFTRGLQVSLGGSTAVDCPSPGDGSVEAVLHPGVADLSPADRGLVLRHELVHARYDQVIDPAEPEWWREGVAEWVAHGSPPGSLAASDPSAATSPDARAEDYRTARLAVAALADHRPGLVADVDAAWGTPELEDASALRDHLVARGVPRATLEIVVDRAQDQAD